ncbi:NADH-quinone oxidoreductase subunit NuoN [Amorphus sp. MBR-141]
MTAVPDLMPLLPELVMAVGALVLLMIGVFAGDEPVGTVTAGAVILIVVAAALLVFAPVYGTTFEGAFILDPFARFMKVLTLIGSGFAIVMTTAYARAARFERFEYPVLVVLATVGMMIMISAGSMLALYLGLELQSLALYVVASINRDSVRSTEAGLKYFVLGALASGMMLYGISLVYGFTGSIDFDTISGVLDADGASIGAIFGIVFVLTGLAFKISAVPFHMWTPDVYEGAPTPVTAFFAAAPKVAALALLMRVVIEAFGPAHFEWQQIIIFISILSMALGAFAAIGQRNIKRLMAYSSIGHVGYALVGLAPGTAQGIQGVILYLTIYVAMTLGVFACILTMRRKEGMVYDIDELAGLARSRPMMAFILAMLMFSLAGIPPLAGFFGKFYVFAAAMQAGLYTLAIIGVLTSVVGAFYYLRIVKLIYFDEAAEPFEPMPGELRVVLGLSGLFIVFFVFVAAPLEAAATAAAQSLF